MKLAVFADEGRQELLQSLLQSDKMAERLHACTFYRSYDDFIANLADSRCDTVIVAHKGALGMQGVRAAKILLHHVPLIWFSDDYSFVEESYRQRCTYFSSDTISESLLHKAFDRCRLERST